MENNEMINNQTLCWYPFLENKKILEIYGEEEWFSNVSTLSIKYNSFKYDQNFDYIIINNVLSYDRNIIHKAKTVLNKNGHILILENNNMALKDIISVPKNRTHISFNNGICKNELDSLIKNDFEYSYYYYPYPDNKTATEVLTQDSINGISHIDSFNKKIEESIVLFDEKEFTTNLMNNRIVEYFANSFLVDVCENDDFYKADYIRIHHERKDDFKIFTDVNFSEKRVIKKPLVSKANKHLEKMQLNNWEYGNFRNIEYKWNETKRELTCEFVEYPCFKDILEDLVNKKDFNELINKIIDFRDSLYELSNLELNYTNEFEEIFGKEKINEKLHWLEKANIDMNFGNVFVDNGKYILIDNEWSFDFPVPAEYIFWLALEIFISQWDKNILNDNKLEIINIKPEVENIFRLWAKHFDEEYVGISDNRCISCELYDVLDEIDQIKSSTSWKITKPLRVLLDTIKKHI